MMSNHGKSILKTLLKSKVEQRRKRWTYFNLLSHLPILKISASNKMLFSQFAISVHTKPTKY